MRCFSINFRIYSVRGVLPRAASSHVRVSFGKLSDTTVVVFRTRVILVSANLRITLA